MSHPLLTVGHSDRALDEFLALLEDAHVDLVVDVRKIAGSRRNPQFGEDVLAAALHDSGFGYRRMTALGGRRPLARDVSPDVNGLWQNRSFHNYADYALSDEFRDGLAELRAWALDRRVAVMCSEAVWWRCHRRIIADHLLARGEHVLHLLGGNRSTPATLTPGAVVHPDGGVTYPTPAS